MLGMMLQEKGVSRQHEIIGLDLIDADYCVDLTNDQAISEAFNEINPDVVVNCAAIIDVGLCDKDPLLAWNLNARAVGVLAEECRKHNALLVQISTDHYFSGDGNLSHTEKSPVQFFNEYARTKFAGEAFALIDEKNLVVRTNIIGFRGREKPTFAEWAFNSVETDQEMTLFEDSYVSCIDTESFADALFDLIQKKANGLFNLANHEVYSKKDLIETIAKQTGCTLTKAHIGSVKKLSVKRANSCGLDVSKAEKLLAYNLPTLNQVVQCLIEKRRSKNEC